MFHDAFVASVGPDRDEISDYLCVQWRHNDVIRAHTTPRGMTVQMKSVVVEAFVPSAVRERTMHELNSCRGRRVACDSCQALCGKTPLRLGLRACHSAKN